MLHLNLKIAIVWDVMPCNLVHKYRLFEETLIYIHQAAWHHIPQDINTTTSLALNLGL
jgi:hypothetical protein